MNSITVFVRISEEWRIEQQFDADHWWPVSFHPSAITAAYEKHNYWEINNPDEVFRIMHIEVTATEVDM